MIKLKSPPKDRKFIAFYIDSYEQHAHVCKWDSDLERFARAYDTAHGERWKPVKFTDEWIFYSYD